MPYEYTPAKQRDKEYPVSETLAEMCEGLTTNVSVDNLKYFDPEEQELIEEAVDEMEDVVEDSKGSHSATYYRAVFLSELFGYEDMEEDAQEAACRIALGLYRKEHPEHDPRLAGHMIEEAEYGRSVVLAGGDLPEDDEIVSDDNAFPTEEIDSKSEFLPGIGDMGTDSAQAAENNEQSREGATSHMESRLVLDAVDVDGVEFSCDILRRAPGSSPLWQINVYNKASGELIAYSFGEDVELEDAWENDICLEDLEESCCESSMELDEALEAVESMASWAMEFQHEVDNLIGPVFLSRMLGGGYEEVSLNYTDIAGGDLQMSVKIGEVSLPACEIGIVGVRSCSSDDEGDESSFTTFVPVRSEQGTGDEDFVFDPSAVGNKRLSVIGAGDDGICFTTEVTDGVLTFSAQTFGVGEEKKLFETSLAELSDDGMNEIAFSEASFEWENIDGMESALPKWAEDETGFYNIAENAYCHALREMLGFKDLVSCDVRSVCGYENMDNIKKDEEYEAIFGMFAAFGIKLTDEQKEKFKKGEDVEASSPMGGVKLSPKEAEEELERRKNGSMGSLDGEPGNNGTNPSGNTPYGTVEAYAHVAWFPDYDAWNLAIVEKEYFDKEGGLDDWSDGTRYEKIASRLPGYCGEQAESFYELAPWVCDETMSVADVQAKFSADCAANGLVIIFNNPRFDAMF